MIVEEFCFYQILTPKMQTELVLKLFRNFIARFDYFFKGCETGFRNEFVIKMYARTFKPGDIIQSYGLGADEIVFLTGGQVDLFTRRGQKFMHLSRNSIFNDYQSMFKLKSNIEFKAYTPPVESKTKI